MSTRAEKAEEGLGDMMANERERMLAVAEAYGRKRGFVLREELGWGIHGSVWKVSSQAASAEWVVKIHRHRPPWQREAGGRRCGAGCIPCWRFRVRR